MKKLLSVAEPIFTVLALLVYTGGPLVVILSGGKSEGQQGSTPDFMLVKLLFQLIYIITFLLLLPHWKRALYILFKEKTILLTVSVIWASIFWSSSPALTINRAIAVTGTTLFGVYLSTRYSLKQQLQLLGWAFGLAIGLSILFAVVLPQYGIMGGTHAGTWRGIYTHKNGLGAMMALSTTVFLLLAVGFRASRWLWCGMGASFALLLLSKSSSPLVHLLVLLPAFMIFRTLRWYYTLRTFALSLIAVVGLSLTTLILLYAESLVRLLGKDLTFTGRSKLWVYSWDMIQQRPWLGYGYGSLWKDWYSETSYVWRAVGWEAPSAHNGFLELWLGLGLLGVSIFLVQFLTGLARSVALVSQSRTPEFFLPLMLLLFTILVNLTESTFLDRNTIYWVLYSAAILSLVVRHQQEPLTAAKLQWQDCHA